jgi:hypothetical protein
MKDGFPSREMGKSMSPAPQPSCQSDMKTGVKHLREHHTVERQEPQRPYPTGKPPQETK